ncbi:galactose mutarotase-like protein [Epithele typhae]|uniref:galactose mutarotase-like protein n=1 Tax=Epithele typhae TaxID=378194 RepID=UPI002007CB02|nr:galactose mutarotase-like protein [Epithele typhae]KAH9921186.1 galactose mutarotase-like protein [Epithele typhae]
MTASDPAFTPILLTLPSLTPSLALEVLPAGLTFHRLFVQADGKTHDILIGPEDPTGHQTQKYTNTIIGRYSNRLPVGAFKISRGSFESTVSPQANEKPTVSLHGGVKGFDQYPWEPLVDPSASELFTPAELATLQTRAPSSMIFKRISEDGEEGFPGTLLCETLVALAQPEGAPAQTADGTKERNLGSVIIVHRAKLLDDGKITLINLTQHLGFNLDASLRGGPKMPSVKDHTISIKADYLAETDTDLLSTGALIPTTRPHAHAKKSTGCIGEAFPENGYDDFYAFSKRPPPTVMFASEITPEVDLVGALLARDGPAAAEVVSLTGGKSGLRISFATNQSGVHFYSNNFSAPEKTARKKIHGGSGSVGDGYTPGSAAFLGFQASFATWLDPTTRVREDEDTMLTSGQVYNNSTRMDVWYKAPPRDASKRRRGRSINYCLDILRSKWQWCEEHLRFR